MKALSAVFDLAMTAIISQQDVIAQHKYLMLAAASWLHTCRITHCQMMAIFISEVSVSAQMVNISQLVPKTRLSGYVKKEDSSFPSARLLLQDQNWAFLFS